MKKIIILSALALTSTLSMAQGIASGNMDVSANAVSGCKFLAQDFGFGVIEYNTAPEISKALTIQCSKGSQFRLTQTPENGGQVPTFNPGQAPNRMTLNGLLPWNANPNLLYIIRIDPIVDANFVVTRYPDNNRLGLANGGMGYYALNVTVTSSNQFTIPIVAKITSFNFAKEAGNYSDTVRYSLEY